MFIFAGYQNIAIDPKLVKGHVEYYPQCTLNLDMAACLAFMLFHIIYVSGNCAFSVLRKFWERAALLIVCAYWCLFKCFSEPKQPSLDYCFISLVCKSTLKPK